RGTRKPVKKLQKKQNTGENENATKQLCDTATCATQNKFAIMISQTSTSTALTASTNLVGLISNHQEKENPGYVENYDGLFDELPQSKKNNLFLASVNLQKRQSSAFGNNDFSNENNNYSDNDQQQQFSKDLQKLITFDKLTDEFWNQAYKEVAKQLIPKILFSSTHEYCIELEKYFSEHAEYFIDSILRNVWTSMFETKILPE
ncbi:26196_t:CDS:2, partial [Racocetra persica]